MLNTAVLSRNRLISQLYFQIPKHCGAVFSATRVPSLIILIGLFGVPGLFILVTFAFTQLCGAPYPIEFLGVGVLQYELAVDPSQAPGFPIQFAVLLDAMSPAEKEFGTFVFACSVVLAILVAFAFVWFLFLVLRLIAAKFVDNLLRS